MLLLPASVHYMSKLVLSKVIYLTRMYAKPPTICDTLQVCMNPFFTTMGRISSPGFGQKVRILAKTHFRT